MLNRKQARLLRLLQEAADHGRTMSYQELLVPMEVSSRSNIQRIVVSLIERGFLTWSAAPRRLVVMRRIRSITEGIPVSSDPIVLFIHGYQIANDGVSPSVREIRERFGFTFDTVQSKMIELERSGEISRTIAGTSPAKRSDRFIYVTKKPSDQTKGMRHEQLSAGAAAGPVQ